MTSVSASYVIGLAVAVAAQATGLAADSAPAWHTVARIREPRDAGVVATAPVMIRGRVTWVAHDRVMDGYAVVQDATAGIWVNFRLARQRGIFNPDADTHVESAWQSLAPGMDVVIQGSQDCEGFAPMLLPQRVWLLTPSGAVLPPAPLASSRRLFSGADDSQRVTVEGVLQGFRDDGVRWILVLDCDQKRVLASVLHEWIAPSPSHLVDGVVRVSGVAASRFTTRGEFVSPSLHVCQSEDVTIITPPAHGPFDAPLLPLARLGRFRPEPPSVHRVRCIGTLTHAQRGEYLFIQDGAVGLRVEVTDVMDVIPGDVVEVSGFIDSSRVIAGVSEAAIMTSAVARRVRHGPVPTPVAIAPEEIVKVNAAAQRSGLVAAPGDYDGALVTFPARFVEAQRTDEGGVLLLSSGELTLHASAHRDDYAHLRDIEPGSTLQVTGVLQMDLSVMRSRTPDWRMPLVQRMGVLLRSADDIEILARPAWWNRRRLATALSVVAVGLSLALGWVLSLRREVAAQALRIRDEMRGRREAAVEYQATLRERNRLAANLHDTLLQTLSAIGLQLQSCELSSRTGVRELGRHLALARTMVDKAVAELRGSVWSLRSIPLHGRSFTDACESLGRQLAASTGIDVQTTVASSTPQVPDFVAGNLLLVLQEAMHNAVRHASPRRIQVAVSASGGPDTISLAIEDDGTGFVPGRQTGPEDGHFGLTVMRERVERLGGHLEIASRPGGGTRIHVTVTVHPHDAEFEAA
jgi:signal transduction histidine kinase